MSSRIALALILIFLLTVSGISAVEAHRSGCHRWHSCPSDRGTYVCGDLGHCSACPDNAYCKLGKPRARAQNEAPVEEPNSAQQTKAPPSKAAPAPAPAR